MSFQREMYQSRSRTLLSEANYLSKAFTLKVCFPISSGLTRTSTLFWVLERTTCRWGDCCRHRRTCYRSVYRENSEKTLVFLFHCELTRASRSSEQRYSQNEYSLRETDVGTARIFDHSQTWFFTVAVSARPCERSILRTCPRDCTLF